MSDRPVVDPGRLAGIGTLDQVVADLVRLAELGAESVLLDPFGGDPEETRRPEPAWADLATVAAAWGDQDRT